MTFHVPAPGWLGTRRWPQRLGARQCSVVAIHFAPEHFACGAFTRYDVDMPSSIARSVRKRRAEFFFGRLAARQALHESVRSGMVLQTTETLAEGWPAGTRCTVDFTLLPEGLVMTAFAW